MMKTLFVKRNVIVSIFIVVLIYGMQAISTHAEDPSLILYFSFDALDNNNVIDHSQYQNHGTLVGTPQLTEGKFGNALKLNGETDWVEVPHHDSLTVDKAVTVMAWIHTPRYHGPHGISWQGILGKSNNPRSYSFYTVDDGTLHFSVGPLIGSNSNGKIALNEWQHIVAQVDGGWHRYWINGKNVGNFQIDTQLPGKADTASVRIGNTHDERPITNPDRHFLGLIDEVRIYNRALSEDEILMLMNTGYQEVPEEQYLREDINKDGVVNVLDLVLVGRSFGATGENVANVNGDNVVNVLDLVLVGNAIGKTL